VKASPASILSLLVAATGAPGPARGSHEPSADLVERLRAMTAQKVSRHRQGVEVDVDKPMAAQGCSDDDVYELIIDLEETYQIEIDDAEYGSDGNTTDKTLTVRALARIVASHL
jgi:hypothetical protein